MNSFYIKSSKLFAAKRSALTLMLIAVTFAATLTPRKVFGQAPAFTYPSQLNFYKGVAATPVLPTGSNIPAPAHTDEFSSADGVVVSTACLNDLLFVAAPEAKQIIVRGPTGTSVLVGGISDLIAVAVGFDSHVYYIDEFAPLPISRVTLDEGNWRTILGIGETGAAAGSYKGIGGTGAGGVNYNHPDGLAVDRQNNVYIADKGNNRIVEIPSGTDTAIVVAKGLNAPFGLAADAYGNIYVADAGSNSIKKINVATRTIVTIGSGFSAPNAVAVDGDGNVYISDNGNSRIMEIPAGSNTPQVLAYVAHPFGISVSNAGRVYFGDLGQRKIGIIEPKGGVFIDPELPPGLNFNQLTGEISGTPTYTTPNIHYTITGWTPSGSKTSDLNIMVDYLPATFEYSNPLPYTLNTPIPTLIPFNSNIAAPGYMHESVELGVTGQSVMAADANGNIYQAAPNLLDNYYTISELPTGGAPIIKITGMNAIRDLAFDVHGNLYFGDADNRIVKKLSTDGTITILGAGLTNPDHLTVDRAGNVYVSDGQTIKEILEVDHSVITLLSGYFPGSVAVDASGNLYFFDAVQHNIMKRSINGAVSTYYVTGIPDINKIVMDASGNIFFGDYFNNLVREILVGGERTIVVSNILKPTGVAVDDSGIVYVGDYFFHIIKKIIPAGGYYISPSLPAGLTFSTATGTIRGTPTTASSVTNFTVTGWKDRKSVKVTLSISVPPSPTPTLSYSSPSTFILNQAITPLSPVSSGISAPAYSNLAATLGDSLDHPVGLAVDKSGNIYVAETNNNLVKKVLAGGGAPVIIYFGPNQIPVTNPVANAIDTLGNLYCLERHFVFKLRPDGQLRTIGGFLNPTALATDLAGNVYVADARGIEKVLADSAHATFLLQADNLTGVAADGAGNIYFCDSTGRVWKRAPDGTVSIISITGLVHPYLIAVDAVGDIFVADSFSNQLLEKGTDGTTTVVPGITRPSSLTFDSAGNIFVSYAESDKITKIRRTGGYYISPGLPLGTAFNTISGTITGTPTAISAPTNYTVTALNANSQSVAYTINLRVNALQPVLSYASTTVVYTFGRLITTLTPTSSNAASFSISPALPAGLNFSTTTGAISGTPTIISTKTSYTISATNASGQSVTTVLNLTVVPTLSYISSPSHYAIGMAISPLVPVGSEVAPPAYSVPTELAMEFNRPTGVAVDQFGNVYVADYDIGTITKIPGNGDQPVIKLAGLNGPSAVAVDGNGNIYVAETDVSRVTKLSSNGVVSVVGSGFNQPTGVAVDKAGNVYVADYLNYAIKEIVASNNNVVTVVDNSDSRDVAVDPAGNIYFEHSNSSVLKKSVNGEFTEYANDLIQPSGLACDAQGNIFIWVSTYNQRIIKVTSNRSKVNISSGFNYPTGIAVDWKGDLYVVDHGSKVKKITPLGGYFINETLPIGLTLNSTSGVISGTPTIASLPTTYTVTAWNATSSASATVNIAVDAPLPTLSYSVTQAYTGGLTINALVPNSTNAVSFSIRPALPVGLVFDTATGAITGTPTGLSAPTNYLVTALNAIGQPGYYTITLTVNAPPPVLNYASTSQLYTRGTAITTLTPTSSNAASYSISPALPSGLSLNASTGIISGTPTVTSPATNYTVTAYNVTGQSSTATLTLTVNAPLPNISYPGVPNYFKGLAIAPRSPAASGVAAPVYNSNPVTLATGFNQPIGTATDAAGNVYVADYLHNTIQKIPAGGGAYVAIGTGFVTLRGVAADAAGNVYVADYGNNAVKEIHVDGTTTTLGSGFQSPAAVAVDAAGNVYVADATNKIKEIPVNGGPMITLISGYNALSIAADAAGNVYFADFTTIGNIVKIPSDRSAAVIIATGFNKPEGIVADASGNIFISDTYNNAVKEIPFGGSMITIGSGFSLPCGLSADSAGNVYVADYGNGAAKKISPAGGYYIYPALPSGLNLNPATGAISGTPTATSPATNYTVTAYNATGQSSTATLTLTVNASLPVLSYAGPQTYIQGTVITALTPVSSGVKVSRGYSISPALPSGLSLNANTGIISGTPTVTSQATNYIITAVNETGQSSTTPLTLTINAPLPNISYPVVPNYFKGLAIATLTPAASNVAAPAFNATPLVVASGFNQPTGVATDMAGNVYLVDQVNNAVKEIMASSGTVIVKLNTGLNGPRGLALDAAGNIYIADQKNNAVKKLSTSGMVTTIGAGFNQPAAVAVDAAGNVYVADFGNGAIKKIPVSGGAVVALTTGYYSFGIAVDAAGAVYFPNAVGSEIFKLPAGGTVSTLAAPGLVYPQGITVDLAGNIFIGDTGNNLVREIPAGGSMVTIASGFNLPIGVCTDGAGNVYVSDDGSNTVKKIAPAGGYYIYPALPSGLNLNPATGAIAGTPTVTSPATTYTVTAYNATGQSSTATINLAINALLPTINYTSPQSFLTGTAITSLVPLSSNVATAAYSAPVTLATLDVPGGITRDNAGNIYVSYYNSGIICKIPKTGGLPVPYARGFNKPVGLVADDVGDIYVTESGSGLIKKILPGATTVNILSLSRRFTAALGITLDTRGNLYVTDGGIYEIPNGSSNVIELAAGAFTNSYNVAVDAAGNVYASDINLGFVKKLPAGTGTPITLISGLSGPEGVAVNSQGDLFVADTQNGVIKELTSGGNLITIASGFNAVTDIKLDGAGNIYALDFYNNLLKKIMPLGGYFVSPALPAGLTFNGASGIISGTPAQVSPATNYTVTAYNGAGSTTAIINLAVCDATHPYITYSGPNTYTVNTAIQALSPTGSASVGQLAYSAVSTVASTGLVAPYGITIDNQGNVYVADQAVANSKIFNVQFTGLSPINTTIALNQPAGIAKDAMGNLYVTDAGNSLVKKIPAGGGPTVNLPGNYSNPLGVAIDLTGNVFVTDYNNGTVTKIPVSGTNPIIIASGLSHPQGIAVDGAGNVYVCNPNDFGAIIKLAADTYTSSVFSRQFNFPTGIAIDGTGNIYIADTGTGNNTLYKIEAGSTRGASFATGFIRLSSVAVDGSGNIYATDHGSAQVPASVKKFSPTGGYFINTSLPAGLSFNNTTGVISGTPTKSSLATNYTITAYLAGKSGVASVNIAVNGRSNIGYDGPQTYPQGATINSLIPTITGSPVTMGFTGTLPPGLKLNPTTGVITGNPTAISVATNYTITAKNSYGNSTATINITVIPLVAPSTATSGITFTTTTTTSTHISWGKLANATSGVNGNGSSRIVFMYLGGSGGPSPIANTTYTAGSAFRSGSQLGTSGWYCIYNGAGWETDVTGLNAGSTYRVAAMDYNGTAGNEQYLPSGNARNNVTTPVASLNTTFLPSPNSGATPLIATLSNQSVSANNILSPNGDGVNDIWVVKNIAFYPNNTVTVYDHTGRIVFTRNNYANDWAGTDRGGVVIEGTYYYLIDLGNGKKMKGFITVVR